VDSIARNPSGGSATGADDRHRRIGPEFFRRKLLAASAPSLRHAAEAPKLCHDEAIDSILNCGEAAPWAWQSRRRAARECYSPSGEFELVDARRLFKRAYKCLHLHAPFRFTRMGMLAPHKSPCGSLEYKPHIVQAHRGGDGLDPHTPIGPNESHCAAGRACRTES
jgi:hypothetical protein